MLEKSVGEDVGEECWRREVLQRGVVERCRRRVLETSVVENVGHRSTDKKCRQLHSYLIMTGPS